MAEEDILWGKNRHFFGGIEPSNMRTFTAVVNDVDGAPVVTITAIGPVDTVITDDYHNICEVGGYVIRKSETDYPKDEFDGELIYEETNPTILRTITDSNVENGKVYYYAAFPYSKQGVYNRNKANRDIADLAGMGPVPTYVYGYDLDLDDSNPATRVTYPEDVDNSDFEAAGIIGDTGTFDYGGWSIAPGEKFMPRPCMLKYDGTVDHYLNPADYTKKVDSTPSDISNVSFEGNAMMEWPKIYTKRWEENGVYHFRCSDVKMDEDYECWCNYDESNNETDHFYTGIYSGSIQGTKIRSVSGVGTGSGKTATTMFTYASNNGKGWNTELLVDRLLITDLLVMMGCNTDVQSKFGVGYGDISLTLTTGGTNIHNMFWGVATTWSGRVKVFGMEDLWGSKRRLIAGWVSNKGVQRIKFTPGTKDGTNATGFNTKGTDYLYLDNGATWSSCNGYVSECETTVFGRLPIRTEGTWTTYEPDTLKCDPTIIACAFTDASGPFGFYMDRAYNVENTGYGCSLSYRLGSA